MKWVLVLWWCLNRAQWRADSQGSGELLGAPCPLHSGWLTKCRTTRAGWGSCIRAMRSIPSMAGLDLLGCSDGGGYAKTSSFQINNFGGAMGTLQNRWMFKVSGEVICMLYSFIYYIGQASKKHSSLQPELFRACWMALGLHTGVGKSRFTFFMEII